MQLSPFGRMLVSKPAAHTPTRRNASARTVPSQADRVTKPTSSSGINSQGRRVASKVGGPGIPDFSHLVTPVDTPPMREKRTPNPTQDKARAATILALPDAKLHPAVAARLAADPGVTVRAARDVLTTIPAATARAANAQAHPFVAALMAVRSLVDGQPHAAVERGPELSQHDRANAAAARRQRAEDLRTGAISR